MNFFSTLPISQNHTLEPTPSLRTELSGSLAETTNEGLHTSSLHSGLALSTNQAKASSAPDLDSVN